MVKMIHADGFFAQGDAEKYVNIVRDLPFVEKTYGFEIENFNMILSGLEPIFSRVLGERVIIDNPRSGVFRRPFRNIVRFEDFASLNEWCFIIALERNTLNIFHHLKHDGFVDRYREYDVLTALDLNGKKVNYSNMFEWDIPTNILLEPNQGVFIRPWVFHSLDDGLVQYYRLITDKKFRVLVIGAPGSSRDKVSEILASSIENSKLIDSLEVRTQSKDIDYSYDGKIRQAYRILSLARTNPSDCVIINMCCPLQEMREIINPDVLIWVDDQSEITIPDWQNPQLYDIKINSMKQFAIDEVIEKIKSKAI